MISGDEPIWIDGNVRYYIGTLRVYINKVL